MAHKKNHLQVSKPGERMLPAMPISIEFVTTKSFVMISEDEVFGFEPAGDGKRLVDAYSLRDAFLRLRTPLDAMTFLMANGPFLARGQLTFDELPWTDLVGWQQFVRELMQCDRFDFHLPEHDRIPLFDVSYSGVWELLNQVELDWSIGTPHGIRIETRVTEIDGVKRNTLFARIKVLSVIEAILATVYLDKLNFVEYRLCALPECQNVYEITSKHEREYCQQACAHKASLRRRRQAVSQGKDRSATRKRKSVKGKSRK